MPWDGNGNWLRTYSWVQDAANGIDITASRVDTEDNGFAAALGNCITRDGQGKPTTNQIWSVNLTAPAFTASGGRSTFNGVGDYAVVVNSAAGNYGVNLIAPNTPNQSFGESISAGTSDSDYAVNIQNAAGTQVLMRLSGAGNITARGVALCKFKASATSRVGSVIVSADPDLQFSVTRAGTYGFFMFVPVYGNATTNQGVNLSVSYTGSFTQVVSFWAPDDPQASNPNGFNVTTAQNITQFQRGTLASINAATPGIFTINGSIAVISPGTLSLNWAQTNGATGNATIIGGGAYATLMQLS